MNKLACIVLALAGLSVSVPAQGRRAAADRDGSSHRATRVERSGTRIDRARRVGSIADNRVRRSSRSAGPADLIGSRRTVTNRGQRSRRSAAREGLRRSRNRLDRLGRGVLRGLGAGRYETVRERVWIPGYNERIWRPAEYGFRYDACGARIRFVVREGCFENVWVPGRYEVQTRRVWVPFSRGRRVICF